MAETCGTHEENEKYVYDASRKVSRHDITSKYREIDDNIEIRFTGSRK
jgi:hypothetical protein